MNRIYIALLTILLVSGASLSAGKTTNWPKGKGTYALIKTNQGDMMIKLMPEIAPVTVKNFVDLAEGKKEFKNAKTNQMEKRPYYNGLIFHRVIPNFMIQGGCPLGTGTGGPGYNFEDECYEKSDEIIKTINDEATAAMVFQQVLIPYMRSTRQPNEEIQKLALACMKQRSGKPLFGKKVADILKKVGRTEPLRKKGKLKATVDYGTLCMANAGPNTNGSQFFIVTKKGGCQWLSGKHTVFGKVISGMDVAHKIEQVKRGAADKPLSAVTIKSVQIKDVK